MKSVSDVKLLRASAALEAAGADAALTEYPCHGAEFVVLNIAFTGGSATSCLGLRIQWKFKNTNDTSETSRGVMIQGGELVPEVWPFPAPGAATKDIYGPIAIRVRGAEWFCGKVYEYGDTSNPGTCMVEAWTETEIT